MKYQKRKRKITEFPPPLPPLANDVVAALRDEEYQRSIERPNDEIALRRECGIGPPLLQSMNRCTICGHFEDCSPLVICMCHYPKNPSVRCSGECRYKPEGDEA